MSEQHGGWAQATPPPGWLPPGQSGMAPAFGPHPMGPPGRPPMMAPMGPPMAFPPALPPRPVYREPHSISAGPLLAGIGATAVWFILFGTLGRDLLAYAWWTVAAAVSAWLVAAFLALIGDRGVAVGIAATSGLGLAVAAGLVAERWITSGEWPLW